MNIQEVIEKTLSEFDDKFIGTYWAEGEKDFLTSKLHEVYELGRKDMKEEAIEVVKEKTVDFVIAKTPIRKEALKNIVNDILDDIKSSLTKLV